MIEYKRRLNRTRVDSSCINWRSYNDLGNTCSASLFITARKRSCGKVMFSVVSVCHFVRRGSHVSITNHHTGTPYLCTRNAPSQSSPHPALLMASGGQHWKPVETCSLEDHPPTGTDIWWLLKHVWTVN